MYRNFIALALAGVLAACTGGNPNDAGNDEGVGTGDQPLIVETDTETVGDTTTEDAGTDKFGADINADLTMNNVDFDEDTGEIILNNMPFDGEGNRYARAAAASDALGAAGSTFDAYANVGGGNSYFAVFRRTANSQVTAVGTNSYVSFGFGGVAAQRLDGDGSLPNSNDAYVFTGEYAAVRTIIDDTTGSQIQYVAGTVRIDVDIEDFDDIGAVQGIVSNRQFFDENGIEITDIAGADFISLATSQINFDNWTINSSTASVIRDNTATATGNWEGLFTGPNGEEVAGIVFTEGTGPVGIDPDTGEYIEVQVRESGGFIAER